MREKIEKQKRESAYLSTGGSRSGDSNIVNRSIHALANVATVDVVRIFLGIQTKKGTVQNA